jgi:hypothetical protein
VKNYNTIEEFKNADKRALFNTLSDEVCIAFSLYLLPGKLGGSSHDFKVAALAFERHFFRGPSRILPTFGRSCFQIPRADHFPT